MERTVVLFRRLGEGVETGEDSPAAPSRDCGSRTETWGPGD